MIKNSSNNEFEADKFSYDLGYDTDMIGNINLYNTFGNELME